MARGAPKGDRKVIAHNRRARRDYFISDRFEAGVQLVGSEVKSLRAGHGSLSDSYAEVVDGELFLVNCHIGEYPQAGVYNHSPRRRRKLLMHKKEIGRLGIKINERGFTLVPLELYFRGGRVKVELGVAKGKRQYDKREAVRERDQDREQQAALRNRE